MGQMRITTLLDRSYRKFYKRCLNILFLSALCAMFKWKPVRENSVTSKEERVPSKKKKMSIAFLVYLGKMESPTET